MCLVTQHAPGVPKILVGNRCHLAYKREVDELVAEDYARRHDMAFLEVSALCNFNITESLVTLSRVALQRNGMSRTWGINRGTYFIPTSSNILFFNGKFHLIMVFYEHVQRC